MSSHDFEDIINVLDGRPEIVDEVSLAGNELSIIWRQVLETSYVILI